MLSVPKKMNSKLAPPLFIRAPLSLELEEKVRPRRMLLSRGRRTRKEDDEAKNETPSSETDIIDEPISSARVIKLNWSWEDEQNQDDDPLLPGEFPNQQLISSNGGRRLRN